ncbi:MAG: class D beta-lactamase [Magnetococcales bacterium]|nr:class D beta-lactamase [Magnetococcales bacterium]
MKPKRFNLLGAILALLCALPLCQAQTRQEPGLAEILQKAGVTGCIVLLETDPERIRVSDETCGHHRFLPASTFKVVNALIALETGAVREEEIFPWNGSPMPFKAWEKELTLREAMAVSSVPVFQEIARRIGQQRMAEWVTRIGYGNGDTGQVVDRFWLDGPLAISPVEQARFMARLATGTLPFSSHTLAGLRRLIPQEQVGEARLYGKTGWASSVTPGIGWYAGWMESHGKMTAVAVRIPMNALDAAPLRKTLALEALHLAGIGIP